MNVLELFFEKQNELDHGNRVEKARRNEVVRLRYSVSVNTTMIGNKAYNSFLEIFKLDHVS